MILASAACGALSALFIGTLPATDDGNRTTSGGVSASVYQPADGEQGRLLNAATGMCLTVRGPVALRDAEVTTSVCGSSGMQRWSYESDGLLRSLADTRLCLDSHARAVAVLAVCADSDGARRNDVRYSLTGGGDLIPRWNDKLAVTASFGAAAEVVATARNGSAFQRWVVVPDTGGAQASTL